MKDGVHNLCCTVIYFCQKWTATLKTAALVIGMFDRREEERVMPIFRTLNGKLKKLSTAPAAKEKDLQSLVEANLDEVLGMHFLASEYTTTFGGRIDTLAVDYNGAPVIIEYKKNRNDNVINQALSYLKWLQAQKEEFFEMLLIKRLGPEVAKTIQVDWQKPQSSLYCRIIQQVRYRYG